MDVSRHDPDFALPGLNDARAVRSDEAGLGLLVEVPLHLDHVLLRNALGDGHHERDLGLDGVDDSSGAHGGRDEDHGRVWVHRFLCVFDLENKNSACLMAGSSDVCQSDAG